MPRPTVPTLPLFGATSNPASEIGQFGSFQSPIFTQSLATIMSGTAWPRGWFATVLNNDRQFIQDQNAVDFVFCSYLFYLMTVGIAEYQSGMTYWIGNIVQVAGICYVSLQNNNTGNTPGVSSSTYWQAFGDVVGANIASAASIQPGSDGTIFQITGTTNISSILNPNSVPVIKLIFTGNLTIISNTNLNLPKGNFIATPGSTLTLVWNGSAWYEIARSGSLGPWVSLTFGTIYQATQDGTIQTAFIVGSGQTGEIYIDSSPTPSTPRASTGITLEGLIPMSSKVHVGEYYQIYGSGSMQYAYFVADN
jgi:hypothetical protein